MHRHCRVLFFDGFGLTCHQAESALRAANFANFGSALELMGLDVLVQHFCELRFLAGHHAIHNVHLLVLLC